MYTTVLVVNHEVDVPGMLQSYLLIMYSFSVTSMNMAMNDILLKTRFFGYIFVQNSAGLSSTTLT